MGDSLGRDGEECDVQRSPSADGGRPARGLLCPVDSVIQMSERVPGERARIVVQGRCSGTGGTATVVIIHEENGTWSIHGLGVAGVVLTKADMIATAESMVARAR